MGKPLNLARWVERTGKNGETPEPGPLGGENREEGGFNFGDNGVEASGGAIGFEQHQKPGPSSSGYIPQTGPYIPSPTGSTHNLPTPNSHIPGGPPIGAHAPPTTPQEPNHGAKAPPSQPLPAATAWKPPKPTEGVKLGTQEYQRPMKLCKFASSALQYEDANTAIDNLTKALSLLTTGKET
ncbi:vacuolar protein sorting-associated protein VTA1 homolog isoform X2 [Dreissena polymorpha]|uniref:Vta1 C-terminal domain-containing protein n=1 Tax=Dreissena polymorpha TaxID=45954 RepID=A0A9D4BPX1_DREPO|nr:vacuolar protein sorting-associated protein VTA1 homolog isoform X2 [Dreissena polymorpha]XP_052253652.1 vacuolar protein sorting-associated protein VTA1 homolog isoform X2 [Dreissena polymorpha]KAH3700907.1 hypothetical protein DPMN_075888 [Dreissena polymorpha]